MTRATATRPSMKFWVLAVLMVCVGVLGSCGIDTGELAYDVDGQLDCPDRDPAPEPLPQIYVLDFEDPELLAELYEINDLTNLSVVRRDVVERTAVHFGWHRGGAVAPVKTWGPDAPASELLRPVGVDGLRQTDDPCQPGRFDATGGFYDYVALDGSSDPARQFDVVGASDNFLTIFLGEPSEVAVDTAAVGNIMDEFGDERSLLTNRRLSVIAGAVFLGLLGLWLLSSFGLFRGSRNS